MTTLSLAAPLLREDVLHFLGYHGRSTPRPRTEESLGPVLEEARTLIAPRGVHRIVPTECAGALGLEARSGCCLALGLVTIGFDLERRVSNLLADGEPTRALLLDAAGSAAAEEAAEDLEQRIRRGGDPSVRDLAGRGQADGDAAHGDRAGRVPRRFSPGYGSWPITAQRALFDLVPHEEIEVRLLPSYLMTPRKSVSFALWLGADEDTAEECRLRRCATCDMLTCPYRESERVPE